jgi:8-oxo-dGTP diphosphatase
MKQERPKVGIGVLVMKDGKILMTQRKGSHGAGEYAYPGGHLEFGESFEECARREVREEAGVEIENIKFLRVANVTKYQDKHYIDIALSATWKSGEPEVLEPEKATSWKWYELDDLPSPLFEFCKSAFDSLETGDTYYDL